jgi:hypothetical protein
MDFNELIESFPEANHFKIKQPRLWALCIFQMPEGITEKYPAIDLVEVHGQYLLGFNYPPRVNEYFPYQGHIWRIIAEPIQFPTRYNTRTKKRSPLVLTKHVEPYQDETQMLTRLLELSSNS